MKKYFIILLVIFTLIVLEGCSNHTDKNYESTTDHTSSKNTPTIVGYSYYDNYGNFLTDGAEIFNFERNKQDGKLTRLEFEKYDGQIVQIFYEDSKISQINMINNKPYMKHFNLTVNPTTSNNYNIEVTYNLKKTTILYKYFSDHFIQSQTKEYIFSENGDTQIILTEIEEDVFSKSMVDGKSKIIYSEELIYSIGNEPIKFIQNNLLKLTNNKKLVTDDIQIFMDTVNTSKNSFKFETEAYTEGKHTIIYNYNNQREIIESNNEDNLDIKRIDHNSDFSDQPIEYLHTKYAGNVKVFEEVNYYWPPVVSKIYNYQPYYHTDGFIDYIDQFEDNHLLNRYVFQKQDYGYKVIHYSYASNTNDPYVNNNLLNNLTGSWFPSTPMGIVRVEGLYSNSLLKQTIPYEYLLWDN
jgi:hypothetical protein